MNNGLLEQQIRSIVLSVFKQSPAESVCDADRCLLMSVIHKTYFCEMWLITGLFKGLYHVEVSFIANYFI
jgi:hypothetical protein